MLIYIRDGLTMRSLSNNDSSEVYGVIDKNRKYLRTWLPWVDWTDSPHVIENVLASWEKDYENKSDIVMGIFEKGKYVGNMGLHDLKRSNQSAMIGYWLSKDRQGHGIITDCVRALTDFSFQVVGLNRIYIHCAAKNKKSRAVPERLGFMKEGTFQDGEYLHGVFHDLVIYGMVKRNWQHNDVICLISPELEHKNAALEYKQEYIDWNETWINGSGGFMKEDDYEGWLNRITSLKKITQTGGVKCSTYFLFVGGSITGTIQIRHSLNDELLKSGGNIGYGIRPSERGKGYGTKMLALALDKCRETGMDKVLITCDKGNIGSAKTAIKNGGIFKKEYINEKTGNVEEQYLITL